MSFLSKIAVAYRVWGEGRATAEAHRMAEQFLAQKLPNDVRWDGYNAVARMAEYASVEQMAMIYVIIYVERMTRYLDEVSATREFRMRVARSVARACICLAGLQRSGTRFDVYWTRVLIEAAKKHGVKTEIEEISFTV